MRVSHFVLPLLALVALSNSAPVEKRASSVEYIVIVELIALAGLAGFAEFAAATRACQGDGGCNANAVSGYCQSNGQCENAAWTLLALGGL